MQNERKYCLYMKSIKLISYLDIRNDSLVTSKLKKHNDVFLKQGSVDTACGPYCLFMALIILGLINYDDAINLCWIKRGSKFGKMLSRMHELGAFFQKGTHRKQLKALLELSFKSKLQLKLCKKSGVKLIDFCIEQLKQDKPTIIGINSADLSHWLLAVGYEKSEDGKITKLFFLDPSGNDIPNYWNATIDISKKHGRRYPYAWIDFTEDRYVNLEDGISLGLK